MVLGQTNGGRQSKSFRWWWDEPMPYIERENGQHDQFPMADLRKILQSLESQFHSRWFPLANDVAKMSNGTEKPGLGMTIFQDSAG